MNEGRGRLLVGPRVSASVEVDLLEREVVEDAPEVTHHAAVQVASVLVFISEYEIEVATRHPWSRAVYANVAQLLQECYFVGVQLGFVDHGEPPGCVSARRMRNLGCNGICREKRIGDGHLTALPRKHDTVASAKRGKVYVVVEFRAKGLKDS